MRKRAIVIGLSLVIFLMGIILVGVSNVSKRGLVEYKETLGEPLRGSEIMDTAMNLPEAGTYGINFTGSFQGYEGHPIFIIRDHDGLLIFPGPDFDPLAPPPNIIEFDIDDPGFYSIEFNIIVSDDSCVELYQYKHEMGDIRPYVHLFNVGVPVAISGIVGSIVGLFVLSESEE